MIARRKFLYSVGAATLGGVILTAAYNRSKDFEESADIVVVGGGGAGVAAAARASELFKGRIVLLEKRAEIGGNTLISGGFLGVVDPKRQIPLGIEDSEEKHFKDIFENGDRSGNIELIHQLVSNAPRMLEWIERQGVQFQNSVIEIYGSHFPRCHLPKSPNGREYISVLSQKALQRGVEIRTNSPVIKLLTDNNGTVTGVEYETEGKIKKIRTRRGVILTSGGFASNPKLVEEFDPRLVALTSNSLNGSSGEMLLEAQRIGAELIDMDSIQCLPGKYSGGKIRVRFHNDVSRFILINALGERFVDESQRRDFIKEAVLAQPKSLFFAIIDNDGFESYDLLMRRDAVRGIETGDAFCSDTLEGLAKKIGVPPKALVKTVNQYNERVFEKGNGNTGFPIVQPPFWAAKSGMSIHYTMGGIRINKFAQCVTTSGKIIKGLYAAGECTGGIHGKNRIGGNGICDALTFGMIAGESIACII